MADDTWTIPSGGLMRTANVHVPASYDPTAGMPLVLDFHGYSSNADQEALLSGMNGKADSAGFIAIHPRGHRQPSWNAGACCGQAVTDSVDDIGFVKDLLDTAADRLCVDAHRIFVTGMSNGGFLSNRIGCELADRIAAIAPVAGVARPADLHAVAPDAGHPLPRHRRHARPLQRQRGDGLHRRARRLRQLGRARRLHRHAVGDLLQRRRRTAARTCTAAAARRSRCARCRTAATPGPAACPSPALGYTTTNLSATDAMWSFFQAHPLP